MLSPKGNCAGRWPQAFQPPRSCSSGVGKTRRELTFALENDILCFNVESEPELEHLSRIAAELGREARISLRINPNVDAKTHAKIATGKSENKFGIPWKRAREVYARAKDLPGIKVTGIDMHIGSQITQLEPFDAAFERLGELGAAFARRWPRHRACGSGRRSRYSLSRQPVLRRRCARDYADTV